jgi:sporulation protein YlmC with PRC-barrel domain
MRLSELLGCQVVGTARWPYGRVHDVRMSRDGEVLTLIVGRRALKHRLFGRGETAEHPNRRGLGFEIPWRQVQAIDNRTITIKEQT